MSLITIEYGEYQLKSSFYKHANEDNAPELSYLTLGLTGESGEVADNVKKIIRVTGQEDYNAFWRAMNEYGRARLVDELGDTLWYLNKLCMYLGVPIEALMMLNTVKLHERHGIAMKLDWPFTAASLKEIKAEFEEYVDVC